MIGNGITILNRCGIVIVFIQFTHLFFNHLFTFQCGMREIKVEVDGINTYTQLEFRQHTHHVVDKSNVTRSKENHLFSAFVRQDLVSNK